MGQNSAQVGAGVAQAVPYVGTAMSLFQTIKGSQEQRDAKNALDNYARTPLDNSVEESVSTLGADLQREEQARLASTELSALQDAGTRALIGGAGRIEANNALVNRQIGADLDMQQKDIDRRISDDNARIRALQEQREREDIMGLSSQFNAGKNDMYQGFGNVIQATAQAGQNLSGLPVNPQERNMNPVNNITPAGTAPYAYPSPTAPNPYIIR